MPVHQLLLRPAAPDQPVPISVTRLLQGISSQALAAQMEQSLPPTGGKLVGKLRMKRERDAQTARGPAPEPCRDFRLPQHQIPALLMVWEFSQVATLEQLGCP